MPTRRKEKAMTLNALLRAAALVAILATGATTGAAAQTTTSDPHHPDATLAHFVHVPWPQPDYARAHDKDNVRDCRCGRRRGALL